MDRRLGPGREARLPPRPRRRAARRIRALPKTAKPMDALRTAVSAWGAVHDPSWPPTPDEARELTATSPSALAAFARLRQGLEPVAPDPDLDLVAGLPVPGQRHRARRRDGPGARRVLHRRRGARLQRLDLHRPRHHLDPRRPRVGGVRRHRRDEGAAPRRRPVRGRGADPRGRLARARRGVGPRDDRARRPADGLRPPRVPRLRPAGRGAARGRGVDGAQARVAGAGDRRSRTSRSRSSPRSTRTGRSRRTSSSTRRRC